MNKLKGFTLIELMIVVAIIGILSAIAYPSYRDSVTKTRRSDGKVALNDTAVQLERCYTMSGSYLGNANNACAVAALLQGAGVQSTKGFYSITGLVNAATFTLTATPLGVQAANDRWCFTMTLTNAGIKGYTGPGTISDCE